MSDSEEVRLSVHLAGGIPSVTELAAFIELLGGVLVWAGMAHTEFPNSHRGGDPLPLGWELERSFNSFLSEKYEAAVLYGAAGFGSWPSLVESPELVERMIRARAEYRWSPIDQISAFVSTRSLPRFRDEVGTCRTQLVEVVEWSHNRFGRGFLPIEEISSTKSIDVILNLVHLASIFGLQSQNVLKDLVEYVVALLQNWVGQRESSKRKIIMPQISKPMRDLMAGYDKVELEVTSGFFRIKLDRKRK
ncbi:MAG: hypothetical protein H7A19_17085 [Rhodanobacteraceae bacterium]|nr:hypothetical protein [Rhodanobacteraceae bacterium]